MRGAWPPRASSRSHTTCRTSPMPTSSARWAIPPVCAANQCSSVCAAMAHCRMKGTLHLNTQQRSAGSDSMNLPGRDVLVVLPYLTQVSIASASRCSVHTCIQWLIGRMAFPQDFLTNCVWRAAGGQENGPNSALLHSGARAGLPGIDARRARLLSQDVHKRGRLGFCVSAPDRVPPPAMVAPRQLFLQPVCKSHISSPLFGYSPFDFQGALVMCLSAGAMTYLSSSFGTASALSVGSPSA